MRIEAGDDATTTTTTAMTRRRRRGDDTAGRRGDDTTTRTECCHRNVATEPRRCGDAAARRRRGGDDDSLAAAAAPTCLHNRCGVQLPSARSSSLQPPSLAAVPRPPQKLQPPSATAAPASLQCPKPQVLAVAAAAFHDGFQVEVLGMGGEVVVGGERIPVRIAVRIEAGADDTTARRPVSRAEGLVVQGPHERR